MSTARGRAADCFGLAGFHLTAPQGRHECHVTGPVELLAGLPTFV